MMADTKMTDAQRGAMIAFHEKMARAYTSVGKTKDAEAAQKRADSLQEDI